MDTLFFTDEHNMLIEMISDFAKSEIVPIAKEIDQTSRFPSEVISKLGDLGILSIPVPKRYGGSGMDNVAYAAAIMELAKADASIAITVAAHTSLGTMPIVLSGTEEQKKEYVPKLASGEILGAFGLTEPEAGSDAGATKTTAEKKGKDFIVNGGKIFITNAGVAGLLSFTAQIIEDGKNKGIGAFIVPTDINGLTISEPEKKMGWKASDTRQLFFNNMLIEMISDFAKSEIVPIAKEIDQTSRFPSEVISKLGDLGILSIPVPKKYGGSGMDNVAYAAAIMELAKADASIAITVAAHTSLGTMPIVLSGTEKQKKEYVPKLACGKILGAFGLTEPEAGSDAGATKT
ncbi:MAG: acyl-CoA dehydrogenase family protein, partial [Candidatus Neomarinimicrobiota bacterium]|nr:acyl-CoA dehydrogenase family protein [Candidatus Neomarinimicrobiota bacterium]